MRCRPRRVLDVVGAEDPEGLVQKLHHLNPHHIQMTETGELEVVAQIQTGAADDGDRAETRIYVCLRMTSLIRLSRENNAT